MEDGTMLGGVFTVAPDQDAYGELRFAGKNTRLHLYHEREIKDEDVLLDCVRGVSNNGSKLSVINCIARTYGRRADGGEPRWQASFFPHYVIEGDRYLEPSEPAITAARLVVRDAPALFFDFDIFDTARDPKRFIEALVHSSKRRRQVAIGPNPIIAYFTGTLDIFEADTAFGRISAYHRPGYSKGGSEGIAIENTIYVETSFQTALDFQMVLYRTRVLIGYLGLLAGRIQDLLQFELQLAGAREEHRWLSVYWSGAPRHSDPDDGKPDEVLVDGARTPDQFAQVLTRWLDRQADWKDARTRFFQSASRTQFDFDRIVSAANVFDILPSTAVPKVAELSMEMLAAQTASREAFKKLPRNIERDSILGYLGRIGKPALKHKIRHRVQIIAAAMKNRFPDLTLVTDEAVNCRNHYVHGDEPCFDYNANINCVIFFTRTLEFVFAASDLVEAGWDAGEWVRRPTTGQHPFDDYRLNYKHRLATLKAVLRVKSDQA